VSDFISGTSGRLTATRLAFAVLISMTIALAFAMIVPHLGVAFDRDGRHLEFLGMDAYTRGTEAHTIFWIRMPRVLAAMLVGGALAGAGCALQALLRNPLAEPFTLGISSGSSLAAVLAIRIGIEGKFGGAGVGASALLGATATLLVVWRLARIGRQLPPATLILAGVTMSMFCSAASVLIQYTSDFSEVSRMLRWMMGGLDSMQMSAVGYATIPIVFGLAVLIAFSRSLNALAAGPEVAASLGVSVARTQAVVFMVSCLLVGAAIAVAGPIGFVGLIVPHALRAVLGADHRVLLPACVLGGGVLLTLCDTLARTLVAPAQLPTGAVTAVLGGPFFFYLLIKHKRSAALWRRA